MLTLLRLPALALLAVACLASPARAAAPLVAAASDLQFALPEIASGFARATGSEVRLVFGSSGNFRSQIEQGAPYELFFSADERHVQALAASGKARDEGRLYAIGRLAIVAPPGSPLVPDPGLDGLRAALAAGQVRRFAIANPEHAPYGHAAQEALTRAGLWEALKGRLVLGENVSQAAQFALAADAQGGIVAYSQVLSPGLAGRARYALLPEASHAPLRQRMALLRNATPVAEAFYRYLQSPAARAVLARHGFTTPGE